MKFMKRIMPLIACVVVALSQMPTAQAIAYQTSPLTAAQHLASLGLVVGTGAGHELDRVPTRMEGITLLLRLIGKKEEAESMPATPSRFIDVPEWGVKYANYAYASGISYGVGQNRFGAEDPLRLNDYVAMLLRALGYSDKQNDFVWSRAIEKAVDIGLLGASLRNPPLVFTRALMMSVSYDALYASMKNGYAVLRSRMMKADQDLLSGNHVSVAQFLQEGEPDWTEAIVRAHKKLAASGGGTLIFPPGDYLIRPDIIFLPDRVNWLGDGKVRILSKENKPYNVLVSTTPGGNGNTFRNLTFDQTGDAVHTPTGTDGCYLLHVNNTDEVTIENSVFMTYGICAVLVQSSNFHRTEHVVVRNNMAYFERRTDTFYDVSVFNVDGGYVEVTGNQVSSSNPYGFTHWRARTAYEVHMPDGIVNDNSAIDTEVGILHVTWPMLWETYEPAYLGEVHINGNTIRGGVVGVSIWGANTLPGVETRNVSILNNTIMLHHDKKHVPAQGIAVSDGSLGDSLMENITIDGNQISITVESGLAVPGIMNFKIPGADVGAFFFNTKNTIRGLTITNNSVRGFPFAVLNLYRRSNRDESAYHENVLFADNEILESGYARTHDMTHEALFSLGNSRNVVIRDNVVLNEIQNRLAWYRSLGGSEEVSMQQEVTMP